MDITFTFSFPFQFSLQTDKEVTFPADEIKELNQFWTTHGQSICQKLKDITGLSFTESSITCYLNYEFSVSEPFCLQIESNIENMKDNLIHELIHILLSQNNYGDTSNWSDLMELYSKEHFTTRVHIAIHRIHYLVSKTLFPDRVSHIMSYSQKPRYVKAWKIATSEGETVDKVLDLNS